MTFILIRLLGLAGALILSYAFGTWINGHRAGLITALALALCVYAQHAISAHRLLNWLSRAEPSNIPNLNGFWDDVAAQLFKMLRAHQRQQHELQEALASFRTAAQALPDGVVSLNAMGHIMWCNTKAQTHLGLRMSTDAGQPIINIVRNPAFSNYLSLGNWDSALVMRSPRSSGKVLSIQAIQYANQQLLVLSRDITQVEKLERMRQDFIANVSHELKTPLTVLSGFLETIRDLPLTEEQRLHYVQLMHTQADRMRNLVDDLLTLSSLESAPVKGHQQEQIDLSRLSQQAFEHGQLLSAGMHELIAHIELSLQVLGQTSELYSALSNVISNAVRYTPSGGSIRVGLSKHENDLGKPCAIFTVQDTGIGIAAEHIPRLTERFYRVDRSRSRESGGTGLGLAIVKHVVQRHEGTLEIESRPNVGSTFKIQIPLI